MTNTNQLRGIIKRSGLKYNHIATSLGLTPYGLSRKINNHSEFKVSEVEKICDLLNIGIMEKDHIFFAKEDY